MSMRNHEAIEALLAVHALDGLDGDDLAELRRLRSEHGECVECRVIESGLRDVAALLASSLDPAVPPAAGADAIVRPARPSAASTDARPADELAARREGRSRGWIVLAAAAAAFALLVASLATFTHRARPATLADWSQRVVRFDGSAGELAMAYVPGRPGVALWGQDLPDPGTGRTFEIWMIDKGTPVPGGCMTPTDGGVGMYVDADVGATDTMAVTVEPSSCPAEPTSDPVLSATL